MEWGEIRSILEAAADGKQASIIQAVEQLERADYAWPAEASVYILRNYTLEPLEPFLKLATYRRGIRTTTAFADYDTYQQEISDPSSKLRTKAHDLVVLSLWLDNLKLAFDATGRLNADAVIAHVEDVVAQLQSSVSAQIAISTFLPPAHATYSWEDSEVLAGLNASLRKGFAENERVVVVNFSEMMTEIGADESLDPRYWFMFKSPLKKEFLQVLAKNLSHILEAGKGLSRKVLVLDCDETLWSGVVGEDGLDQIGLNPDEYPGNAHYAFQRQILALKRRGVLVALCSKNNEADVFKVLDRHSHSVLKREDLAAWRINWTDKVSNLKSLAEELNLGLDSFVFVDDSPMECDLVRSMLPMVDVLDVPKKRYELPGILQRYAGFKTLVLSDEDRARTSLYQAAKARRATEQQYATLDEFLASLGLRSEIGQAERSEFPRIAQLTQKTNQFNLTTRRYGVGEIEAFANSENHLVVVMQVSDKWGDYGLTGGAIIERDGDIARIDTLLMSCRILGRQLEQVFLREILAIVRARWGKISISAEYIRTPKNTQVADFFDRMGFTCTDATDARRNYHLLANADPIAAVEFINTVTR